MSQIKLTYFDAPVSRGEECRLALHVAGVEFEDNRIRSADWPAMKASTPFGALPVLEMPGQPPLAQSNAILVLIGRMYGIHPKDDFVAARHEAILEHVEDLRANVSPTMRIKDEEAKKAAREALVASFLPTWAANVERIIGDGPFFGGSEIHVVDIKLYMAMRWFKGGALDHIPATIFASYAKLNRLYDAVEAHPRVKAWNEAHAKK